MCSNTRANKNTSEKRIILPKVIEHVGEHLAAELGSSGATCTAAVVVVEVLAVLEYLEVLGCKDRAPGRGHLALRRPGGLEAAHVVHDLHHACEMQ